MGRFLLILSLALLVVAPGRTSASPSATEDRPRVRLMLAGGGFTDVLGPVERKGGQILFFNANGSLMSLRADLVTRIVPASQEADDPQPSAQPSRAGGDPDSSWYSNRDLPENPPAEETTAEDPEGAAAVAPSERTDDADAPEEAPGETTASETTTAESSPTEGTPTEGTPYSAETESSTAGDARERAPDLGDAGTEAPEVSLVPVPSEIDGHDEAWWREQVGTIRAGIARLETDEAVAQRQYDCSLRGIDPAGTECRPQINQMALVGRQPKTPQQKRLAADLSSIRKNLETRREELASFISEAMRLGVPTGWLL